MESTDSGPAMRTGQPATDLDDRTEGFRPVLSQDIIDDVDAILEGGPADLPLELRVHRTSRTTDKVKVPYYGGYEHFERVGTPAADDRSTVYRWIGRTRIAE
ncbi:DUF5988 family protein [Micromonospora cathayae]|uniref:DUF5988 family protein n=1 Tax=Micromonospora cathayae TaxID=3028804 RepID=A0ABY7ZX15_9ACTN|nr:DUF5988 family protein [Micromonospora sp. HUAS 3]WDZ86558.1 DUF5988 family protein [Micromonospora sp. HUAS 3]